jgi:TolA-binding protein
MTAPARWAASGSEVDPVVRSVMRYAQRQTASPEAVARVLERVQAVRELGDQPAPRSQRALRETQGRVAMRWLVRVAAAAVIGGGLAWAGFGIVAPERPERGGKEPVAPVGEPRQAAPPVVSIEARSAAPTASAPAVETALAPSNRVAPSGSSRVQLAAPPSSQSGEDEIAVLQEARRLVASNPSAALALSRDHAARYPRSRFREEREALVVQALLRQGRTAEATNRFRAFERSYPRSAYRRRLEAALGAAGASAD